MNTSSSIEARLIGERDRISALPAHFGRHQYLVERRVYDFMSAFAADYRGGYWEFLSLSNGGFYMRPPAQSYALRVDSNGFQGAMSADAAGITMCLFAFSHLAFEYPVASFTQHFHWLREFSLDHREARLILAAID